MEFAALISGTANEPPKSVHVVVATEKGNSSSSK